MLAPNNVYIYAGIPYTIYYIQYQMNSNDTSQILATCQPYYCFEKRVIQDSTYIDRTNDQTRIHVKNKQLIGMGWKNEHFLRQYLQHPEGI
jgi:hypothetical protein